MDKEISDLIYSDRFKLVKKLFWLAILGLLLLASFFVFDRIIKNNINGLANIFAVLGILLILPLLVYSQFLAFVHWKERYRGDNSDGWVILFVIFSGNLWFAVAVFYYFMHVFPDMKKKGIYKE
ncbi:MAG TPA: hypothetical protein DET40_04030 [Lentisphaeria bacterium]|nr:MAG: hypothetical protein A2X45_01910 [Lentisphaerae bacterium GWF2_50_93]HCE42695.1 hypothetical protein [Lentisphaeria bacterium]